MFEELNKRRQAVAANIAKSFENDIEKALGAGYDPEDGDGDNVEKAHQVGDIHPNGKWVWTQLPSGKFDWRVIKKNATEKNQEDDDKGDREVKIDNNEYKKQYNAALKQLISGKDEDKNAVNFALNISRSNISETKKELKELKENRPGAKKAIQKLESDLVKFYSQEKAFNDALKSNDRTQMKPKKSLIGEGTNGPEKKEKEESTRVDALKYESKNGFKFKKSGHYTMRYNQREKAYEIWEQGDIYGAKIAMMRIKSENENIGTDIIKHMKEKYSKGGSGSITYSNTTYGF